MEIPGTADEAARLLREADCDLAKGLTISDICRKIGIAEPTYHRWQQQHDPGQVDMDCRCRELEIEFDRLKRLVAELRGRPPILWRTSTTRCSGRHIARTTAPFLRPLAVKVEDAGRPPRRCPARLASSMRPSP